MKKVKIMLLSLALFAVVGGALAFKAKFEQTFCTADAYFNSGTGAYYCSFTPQGQAATTKLCTTQTSILIPESPGALKVCTTPLNNGTCGADGIICQTTLTSVESND